MKLKNIGLQHLKNTTVENCAAGLRVRRVIHPLLRRVLKLAAKRKIVVLEYPDLPRGKPYIFASTHFFDEDVISNLIAIDRDPYILFGTTNQLEYNRQVYAAWLNGMLYIDRLDADSRKSALPKMEKVIRRGASILMFPEGGWNNTENLLIQRLFPGVWALSQSTGAEVVPVAAFCDAGSDMMYLRYGPPMDLGTLERDLALELLRDAMATMLFEMMEQYGQPLRRADLTGDFHYRHMESRLREYQRVPWTRDVWDEELTVYRPRSIPLAEDVWAFVDEIDITPQNARILAPILARRAQERHYDFKAFMHENWDRKV